MYMDSQSNLIDDVTPLVELARRQSVVIFSHCEHANSQHDFVKNDRDEKFRNDIQLDSSWMLFKKNNFSMEFVQQWLKYYQDGEKLKMNQFDNKDVGFEGPHEQDILSRLSLKMQIPTFRDPSHWGLGCMEEHEGYYGTLIFRST